jgi:predicted amidohydrolase YtcJ
MRTLPLVMAWVTCLIVGASARAAQPAADLIVLNGAIHTQDAAHHIVAALAVRGNTIVAVGSNAEVRAHSDAKTHIVDLAGRVVLPGIIDAHVHPASSAPDLDKCSLGDQMITPAEVKARVGKCLRESPGDPKRWFEVVQVNASGLTLARNDLDSILAARPMILSSADGHTAWVNSAALRVAHIDAATREPSGGRIERDADGRPSGTLRDAATDLAMRAIPAPELGLEARQTRRAFELMRAVGITTVQDAAVDEHLMQIYKRLYDTHQLTMRVRACYELSDLHIPAKQLIDGAVRFRNKWAIDPDYLRADAVKIFADGVIEYPSQTAALLEPYLDGSGHPTKNRGPSYFTQQNLNAIVAAADAAGLTVHVHAIGDRAVRSVLDAFAYSRRVNGSRDNRDQIAHLELVDPADLARFKALDVIANFQLLWAEKDDYIVKATIPYIGAERAKHLYPAGALHAAGAVIAGGSDWGVSSFNAFEAMERAVTRAEARGREPLLPGESIPLSVAVDAYTSNAAFALRQEQTIGSLEVGKRGDFIVLDRDIFAIDPFELHDTKVLATYLDGRQVYAAPTR